jgi:DNA ligase 4
VPTCHKARDVRGALKWMKQFGEMAYVETKYDGQRMQIHVDLSLARDKQITIFSKSKKDSTKKRAETLPLDP